MSKKDFTTTFVVDQTPKEVFDAINNVKAWWSGDVKGTTNKQDGEFTYSVQQAHRSTQKITTFIPGKKIVWLVTDAHLSFVKNNNEWKGTEIIFDIAEKGHQTEVKFTHKGLAQNFECYDSCSNAWGMLVQGNLRNLIKTGKDQPSPW